MEVYSSFGYVIGHPYDIIEEDVDTEYDEKRLQIRIWCMLPQDDITKKSNTFVVVVNNFKPRCYIELPNYFHPFGSSAKKKWCSEDATKLIEEICKISKVNPSTVTGKLVKKSKLYYYQPEERSFTMLELNFETNADMSRVESTIENAARVRSSGNNKVPVPRGRFYGQYFGNMVLRAWEGQKNIVSSTRRLLTLVNIEFAQWSMFKPDEMLLPIDERNNYRVPCAIINLPQTVSGIYKQAPEKIMPCPDNFKPKLLSAPSILAYDIEVYSHRPSAFPNALNYDDKMYMVSCIFYVHRGGMDGKRRKFLIHSEDAMLSHDMNHPAYKEEGMDEIEFIVTEDEGTIMDAFASLIDELDPDIITGYNIHGFDYSFMDIRNRITGRSVTGDWPVIFSRSKNQIPKAVTSEWKSNAYGTVKTTVIDMEGRMSIDMLPVVKRNYRLSIYSLKFVASEFLPESTGKLDVTPQEMFKTYKSSMDLYNQKQNNNKIENTFKYKHLINCMTRVAAYAIRDSELVIDLFEKLNTWPGLVELSSVAGVTIKDTFRGQQTRVLSLLYDLCAREDVVIDSRAFKREYTPIGEEPPLNPAKIKFKGGFVMNPKVGITPNVICGDFVSLYPSIILGYNICFSTLNILCSLFEETLYSCNAGRFDADIAKKTNQKQVLAVDINKPNDSRYSFDTVKDVNTIEFVNNLNEDDEGCDIEDGEDDDSDYIDDQPKKKSKKQQDLEKLPEYNRKFSFKFAAESVKKGIIPRLVAKLLTSRKEVKRQMGAAGKAAVIAKEEGDTIKANEMELLEIVLNQRQLAYKMIANSTYGFLAAQDVGKLPIVECAMSITAMGRQLIGKVNDHVRTKYDGSIIYGDSVTGDTPLIIRRNNIIGTRRIDELNDVAWISGYHGEKDYIDDPGIEVWTEDGFTPIKKIIRHRCDKPLVRVITNSGLVDCTTDHSLVRPCGNMVSPNEVKIGEELLHSKFDISLLKEFTSHLDEEEAREMGLYVAGCNVKSIVYKFKPLFHNEHLDLKIPDLLLSANINIVSSFWNAFCSYKNNYINSKELYTGLSILALRLGRSITEFYSEFKLNYKNNKIKEINPLYNHGEWFVYDLETGNHHFHVGPGNLVVHNTDSSMFTLPHHIKEANQCHEWGEKVNNEITQLFPRPLTLEFEKAMRIFCLKKKKYAAFYIQPDGSLSKNMLVRGIVLARRDNCKYLRSIYDKSIREILLGQTPIECFKMIYNAMIELLEDKVPLEDLSVVVGLGSNYKSPAFKMAVFANECAKIGRPVQAGDRLEFLIAKKPSSIPDEGSLIKPENLGFKMRMIEVWKQKVLNGTAKDDPLDYMYYIEHQFKNPLDQIFSIAFPETERTIVLDKKSMIFGSGADFPEDFDFKGARIVTSREPLNLLCSLVSCANSANAKISKKEGKQVKELSHRDIVNNAKALIKAFENNYKK